jgi:hypothetical protein
MRAGLKALRAKTACRHDLEGTPAGPAKGVVGA